MKLIKRADWGARPPKRPNPILNPDKLLGVSVHVVDRTVSKVSGLRIISGVQNWHMDGHTSWKKPWSDIAYCYGVSRQGEVFEAQGLDSPGFAEGQSWNGQKGKRLKKIQHNGSWISIVCLTGSLEEAYPPMLQAVGDLVEYIAAAYPSKRLEVKGHRDILWNKRPGDIKTCPGDPIASHMREFNARANLTPKPVEKVVPTAYDNEFAEAISLKITSGEYPDSPATRRQAAVMALRASKLRR